MKKIENIVSKLNADVNQQNNEEFVIACLMFYKQLQCADIEIVNTILNHEANKVIIYKIYNLSKLNGNKYNIFQINFNVMYCTVYDILDSNNMYQMLTYDSLTKLQKLSIKSTEALLNTCFYRSKFLY